MLNLQQEVQALLSKGENLGPGVFDAVADDIEKLTTQIVNLRKKSQPTTAADTETPEAEVKESTPLSLEGLYKEIKAVPGNTGLGNDDNEVRQMYYFVDEDGNINRLGKLTAAELEKIETEYEDSNGFILSDEDFKELNNIE